MCLCVLVCVNFGVEILLRGKNVKPGKNSIFMKNGKTVILVGNWKSFGSKMMKQTSPLNSSCKILLPRRISSDSETVEISRFSRHRVSGDTWQNPVDAT